MDIEICCARAMIHHTEANRFGAKEKKNSKREREGGGRKHPAPIQTTCFFCYQTLKIREILFPFVNLKQNHNN